MKRYDRSQERYGIRGKRLREEMEEKGIQSDETKVEMMESESNEKL